MIKCRACHIPDCKTDARVLSIRDRAVYVCLGVCVLSPAINICRLRSLLIGKNITPYIWRGFTQQETYDKIPEEIAMHTGEWIEQQMKNFQLETRRFGMIQNSTGSTQLLESDKSVAEFIRDHLKSTVQGLREDLRIGTDGLNDMGDEHADIDTEVIRHILQQVSEFIVQLESERDEYNVKRSRLNEEGAAAEQGDPQRPRMIKRELKKLYELKERITQHLGFMKELYDEYEIYIHLTKAMDDMINRNGRFQKMLTASEDIMQVDSMLFTGQLDLFTSEMEARVRLLYKRGKSDLSDPDDLLLLNAARALRDKLYLVQSDLQDVPSMQPQWSKSVPPLSRLQLRLDSEDLSFSGNLPPLSRLQLDLARNASSFSKDLASKLAEYTSDP